MQSSAVSANGAAGGRDLAPLEARQQEKDKRLHAGPSGWTLFGLRRNSFMTAAPNARAPMAMTFANLRAKTPINANSPSFFAAIPPINAASPYSAIWSVLALKSS